MRKKGTIVGKGVINNRMTNFMFKKLEEAGIPTHYIEELSDRETAVKKVEIVPLEVIVRNVAAGSFQSVSELKKVQNFFALRLSSVIKMMRSETRLLMTILQLHSALQQEKK